MAKKKLKSKTFWVIRVYAKISWKSTCREYKCLEALRHENVMMGLFDRITHNFISRLLFVFFFLWNYLNRHGTKHWCHCNIFQMGVISFYPTMKGVARVRCSVTKLPRNLFNFLFYCTLSIIWNFVELGKIFLLYLTQ